MAYGFNSNVEVGDALFHVQTESCSRPEPAIESTVFVQGSVEYMFRRVLTPEEQAGGIDQLLRQQHLNIISELKSGGLRGRGPMLTLDWENQNERPSGGKLSLRLRASRNGRPAAGCRVSAMIEAESGTQSAVSTELLECKAGENGSCELATQLPPEFHSLTLLLQAQEGLSITTRRFRVNT